MRFLNKQDINSISRQLIQDAVKEAYLKMLKNDFNMPDRMHVEDTGNTLLLMPCFSKDFFSTKLVSVFPDASQYKLPSVNGILVLNDNLSGKPLAVMDGAALTAQRTGAVGGLGIHYLTPNEIKSAGIFGAGVQGLYQAKYLLLNRSIKTLYLNSKSGQSAEKLANILSGEFKDTRFVTEDNPEQMVEKSDLVIAATTSSKPVFNGSDINVKGKTFISIGSFRPDMQEFPDEVIVGADHVYVDTLFAVKESGDICHPIAKQQISEEEIEQFASLLDMSTFSKGNTYMFKSVGMALFDLTVSTAIYEWAQKEDIGQILDF